MRIEPGPAERGALRRVRVVLTCGSALDEDTLRAMWRFRLSVMKLKPAVDAATDWEKYAGFARAADHVALLWDGDGAVCGTAMFALVQGQGWLLALMEYVFVAPGLQGNPMLPRAAIRLLVAMFRARRGRRLFAAGAGYPVSMLLLGRYFPPLFMDGEPITDPLLGTVLEAARARLAGAAWNAERGNVELPTIPPEPPPWWFAMAQRDPAYARYTALNPHWRLGFGLVCLSEIHVRHALVLGVGFARRTVRQLRRGLGVRVHV